MPIDELARLERQFAIRTWVNLHVPKVYALWMRWRCAMNVLGGNPTMYRMHLRGQTSFKLNGHTMVIDNTFETLPRVES